MYCCYAIPDLGGERFVGSKVFKGLLKTFEYLVTPHHSDNQVSSTYFKTCQETLLEK
jgi:hypothetical protein